MDHLNDFRRKLLLSVLGNLSDPRHALELADEAEDAREARRRPISPPPPDADDRDDAGRADRGRDD